MDRKPGSASLKLEALEIRDVPAVVLNAMLNAQKTDIAPIGGQVSINEIQVNLSDPIFTRGNRAGTRVSRPGSDNDVITFSLSGNTLTITNTDGIFGRAVNANNILVNYGNTLTIAGVTGFTLSMPLGGNDVVTDNTPLPTTIDAGPGNDTINARGVDVPLTSFLLYQNTGTFDANLLAALTAPAKSLSGSDGNDIITASGSTSGWYFDGGSGSDQVTGPQTGFANTFIGGDGDDRLQGPILGTGNSFDGGYGNDTILGGFGSDTISGGAGFDMFVGFGGRDLLLARDVDFDYILNLPGDTVLDDPFDVRTFRPAT